MTLNRRQRDAAQDAVTRLSLLTEIARIDPEHAHGEADTVLLDLLLAIGHVDTDAVVDAYRALEQSAPWWASA